MNDIHTFITEPNDKVDQVLSDFFRGEMPAHWPKPPVVAQLPAAARRGRTAIASRLALAASLGLLLLTGWLISGRVTREIDRTGLGANDKASVPEYLKPHK